MPSFSVFRLRPQSSLHIGERGVGLEASGQILQSDTLFSALCSTWRLMDRLRIDGNETIYDDGRLVFSLKDPPFRISSVFPFVVGVNHTNIFLFPRPLSFRARFQRRDPDVSTRRASARSKEEKRVQLISDGVLRSLITGSFHAESLAVLDEGKVLVREEEKERLKPAYTLKSAIAGEQTARPRVTVDRLSSRSELWHVGNVYFRENVGLYFLFTGDNSSRRAIEEALVILQDEGMGGERTYGIGRFELMPNSQITFPDVDGEAYVCLSLYHPSDGEEAHRAVSGGARVKTMMRLGYFHSPDAASLRRRPVRMIAEGSVLKTAPKGSVVAVEPTAIPGGGPFAHRVYRYGLCLGVGGKFFSE